MPRDVIEGIYWAPHLQAKVSFMWLIAVKMYLLSVLSLY